MSDRAYFLSEAGELQTSVRMGRQDRLEHLPDCAGHGAGEQADSYCQDSSLQGESSVASTSSTIASLPKIGKSSSHTGLGSGASTTQVWTVMVKQRKQYVMSQ